MHLKHIRLLKANEASAASANDSHRLQAAADVVTSATSQSTAASCGDCRLTAAVEHFLHHSHSVCVRLKTTGLGLPTFSWVTLLATWYLALAREARTNEVWGLRTQQRRTRNNWRLFVAHCCINTCTVCLGLYHDPITWQRCGKETCNKMVSICNLHLPIYIILACYIRKISILKLLVLFHCLFINSEQISNDR